MTNSDQLLRITEVSHLTSLAKSTINLWVAQGKFPKPIKLGERVTVWDLDEVEAFIAKQRAATV